MLSSTISSLRNTSTNVATTAAAPSLKLKAKLLDRLVPSDKMMNAARQGKVLSGEKFAMFKQAGRGLWNSKGGLVAGLVVGGGAVAAAMLHSQWLPGLLHLATSPVGIGVMAGIAGLALIAGGLYLGRQLTSSVKNARAANAHAVIKQEKTEAKQAEKQKKTEAKQAAGLAALNQLGTAEVAKTDTPVQAEEITAPLAKQKSIVAEKAASETGTSVEDTESHVVSRQVSDASTYSDPMAERQISSRSLGALIGSLNNNIVKDSHKRD